MQHLPDLIVDLALILVVAGVVGLLFKRLKQPLVLGYIVAGILTSPNMPYTPSVGDTSTLSVWADIGVIFLMFTLGLEFSFKKIVKMGAGPIIAACLILFCMMSLGSGVGHLFGWGRMNSLFLGAILSMSSTTIIYKALDDLGLRQQKFAGTVLSVLVIEDILGVLLMVMLGTLAASRGFEGEELLGSLLRLMFYLCLWFMVGIFLIPIFLRKVRKWMNRETLLVVSLGLCFGMVVMAAQIGYSTAFGAFMMGSILAETVEAEMIDKIVTPVKDLFGAVFFVSVGMLVDPAVILTYWLPILVLVVTIILGQIVLGSSAFLLSGQPLKQAMQCGFSMTQIGEFSFILASLGNNLKVTDGFLYPVIVAVSIITTFTTPYLIRSAEPAYQLVQRLWPRDLSAYHAEPRHGLPFKRRSTQSSWSRLLMALLRQAVAYIVLTIAVTALFLGFLLPLGRAALGHWMGNAVCGVLAILVISPFLRAFVMKKNHSEEFKELWEQNLFNRGVLIVVMVVRFVLASLVIAYILNYLSPFATWVHVGIAMIIMLLIVASRRIKLISIRIERTFFINLRSREILAQKQGTSMPGYARLLQTKNLHIAQLELPEHSTWAGHTLSELSLGRETGVMITSIIRDTGRYNIPDGTTRLYPSDKLEIIGDDESIKTFVAKMEHEAISVDDLPQHSPMVLKTLMVLKQSPLAGITVGQSQIRERFHCMVVGLSAGRDVLEISSADSLIKPGSKLWIVGEKDWVEKLCEEMAGWLLSGKS